uniref:Uncharacterized protein n=1 Tax=Trichogramma kaykai TaxID=54128 RepID=A0ABD2XEW0_9HYME
MRERKRKACRNIVDSLLYSQTVRGVACRCAWSATMMHCAACKLPGLHSGRSARQCPHELRLVSHEDYYY